MSVRCKFKVINIAYSIGHAPKLDEAGARVKDAQGRDVYGPCKMATIKMSPVYSNGDPNHENSKFWAASPGGTFELNCVNEAAVAQLELDGEYYFDISPAAK
jgi:hypothetical protein